MREKLISVVMPVYNREKTVRRAAESVLNQEKVEVELIVVDDGSTDGTQQAVSGIDDTRIRYTRLKKNSGACVARNTGIDMARGWYVAFQDSDDEWDLKKLRKQLDFLEKTGADMCFCSFKKISKGKNELVPDEDFVLPEDAKKRILMGNMISTQTMLVKKEVFDAVRFDKSLPRFQDWDVAVQIASRYKIVHLNEPLVNVYVQQDSISMNSDKGTRALRIFEQKYHNEIFNDAKVMRGYLRYKCFLCVDFGVDVKKSAAEYLRKCGIDFKVLVIYLMGAVHLDWVLRRWIW